MSDRSKVTNHSGMPSSLPGLLCLWVALRLFDRTAKASRSSTFFTENCPHSTSPRIFMMSRTENSPLCSIVERRKNSAVRRMTTGPASREASRRDQDLDIQAMTERLLREAGSSLVQGGEGPRPPAARVEEGCYVPEMTLTRVPTIEECAIPPPPISPDARLGESQPWTWKIEQCCGSLRTPLADSALQLLLGQDGNHKPCRRRAGVALALLAMFLRLAGPVQSVEEAAHRLSLPTVGYVSSGPRSEGLT